MTIRYLAASTAVSVLLAFATSAVAESPNDKVQVPDGKVCAKPLKDNRCKRKDLKDAPTGLRLTDYVGVSTSETFTQPAPTGTAYGQVRVSVTNSQALAQALTKKDGWLRTFMPQARGVVISVAARANSTGQVFDVLPRTPVIVLDVPLPASGQNARSLATVNEVRSGWMRLDAGVQYNLTLNVDTVSEQKFAGLDNVLSRVANIYTSVTGDQLLGSMSNAALKNAATNADRLITEIVDPDGRDKRTLSGGGYLITPTNGGTKALVFDIRDERNGNPIATVRVELLFTSTLIQPTAVTDPAQLKLAAVNQGAVLKNYKMTTDAAAATTLGTRPEYVLLLQQVQAGDTTPGTITKHCGEFQNTASSWGLTTLDAALLNYEALDDASRQNAGNAAVLKKLERQRCIRDADWATLKQLDRQPPPAPALGRNPLTVADLASLGSYFIKAGSAPSLSQKFATEVAINAVASDLPFQGSFFSTSSDAFDTVRSLTPSRFCCISGASAEGRVQLALDLAPAGAAGPQPVVAELWTAAGDPLVAELRLRAPNAAEATLISSKWPKQTVATLAPTQGGAP
jgi:hypothetical protein